MVRSIGSELHMDYTAVGQTTHLASRIEQLAKPGTTLLSDRHARNWPKATSRSRRWAAVPVKGLTEPIEVF